MACDCGSSGHNFVEHSKSGQIFCSKCGEFKGTFFDAGLAPGLIAMWSGSADRVPAGWKLCDGSDGRPDLRDKFVVGSGGAYVAGSTGGCSKVTLTIGNLPAHKHARLADGTTKDVPIVEKILKSGESTSVAVTIETIGNPQIKKCSKGCQDLESYQCRRYRDCRGSSQHNVIDEPAADKYVYVRPSFAADTGLGGQAEPSAFDVLPPYYAMAFIIRIDVNV